MTLDYKWNKCKNCVLGSYPSRNFDSSFYGSNNFCTITLSLATKMQYKLKYVIVIKHSVL